MKAGELKAGDFFNIGGQFHVTAANHCGRRMVDGAAIRLLDSDYVTPATAEEVEAWQLSVIGKAINNSDYREKIVRYIATVLLCDSPVTTLSDHADNLRSLIDGDSDDPLGVILQPVVDALDDLAKKDIV